MGHFLNIKKIETPFRMWGTESILRFYFFLPKASLNRLDIFPAVLSPLPVSLSISPMLPCSFTVMSTNPEIYVPAGKHGLRFIVLC